MADGDRDDPRSTQPTGCYVDNSDGTRSYFHADKGPEASPDPLSRPVVIRMFVDDVSRIGLWPDWSWDYEGSPVERIFEVDHLEDCLPITPSLRTAIRDWVDEYTASIAGDFIDLEVHDRRGYHLSRLLQDQLGAAFRVRYSFSTQRVQDEVRRSRHESS